MSHEFPELDEVRVGVSPETRDRHLAAMSDALSARKRPTWRGRRLLGVVIAMILLLPVLAVAAQDTVPGDFLYPIKRALEPVWSMVDSDVYADNRAREVEAMVDRQIRLDAIRDHISQALDHVDRREAEAERRLELVDRLDRAANRIDVDSASAEAATLESLLDDLRRAKARLHEELAPVDRVIDRSDDSGTGGDEPDPAPPPPVDTTATTEPSHDDSGGESGSGEDDGSRGDRRP